MKTLFVILLLSISAFSQTGHGTFSGYQKQASSEYRQKFAVTLTDVNFTFTSLGVSIGTPAVDDGSGTCGTNFFVEGARLGGGVSPAFFAPAGTAVLTFSFSPAWVDNSTIAYLSSQQVGGCISPAGDINLTAKYTY